MAVDLMRSPKMDDQTAIQEAASQGMRSMEHLIRLLSHQQPHAVDWSELTDHTVSNFRRVISLLDRTGRSRFRRGPVHSSQAVKLSTPSPVVAPSPVQVPAPTSFVQSLTLDFTKPNILSSTTEMEFSRDSFSMSSAASSFMSSAVTGDGSVSNGKSLFSAPAPALSAGKPPLSYKKRCHEHDNISCHCSKRRKNRVKKTVRVPAISLKVADIPADEHSWRKYGQKPIKGSPYPRGYYKCSTVRGCPARKHVERAVDEPDMLIVTYEGDHRHTQSGSLQ